MLNKIKLFTKSLSLAYVYIRDPEISVWKKFLLVFPLIYIISPIDLIPEFLVPILGWVDDTVIALTVWKYMLELIDSYKNTKDNKDEYILDEDEYKLK